MIIVRDILQPRVYHSVLSQLLSTLGCASFRTNSSTTSIRGAGGTNCSTITIRQNDSRSIC
ncbi:hypothetical protein BDZ85DRAFT_255682 [Elsinoe ampelina]|uniref:Uncharacterized protein n=1 Tax=Elsinoe ampelina TaxID=302913 RepID=A0A6A6GR79_9PEZI|nr:hypothetical protein BDZ85DRAFT_255682 [Elsinoe ampelina]